MIYGLRIWTFVCMLIASVSIQKQRRFLPALHCDATHTTKIRQFIYSGVSIFVLWLQYICFPRVKIPPWYFQLSAIGCGGLNRSVLRGQREKMKAGLICRFSRKPCCLFIPSYHADLCQMLGLTHAPPCVSGKSWVWKWILLCNSTCIHNANLFNKRKSQTLTLN